MTPLEEIEQAIAEAARTKNERVLASLYQARAIERLEATVRAIGYMWQTYADETLPLMRKMARHADPIIGYPVGTCYGCGKAEGEQHRPHCEHQGIVSKESTIR